MQVVIRRGLVAALFGAVAASSAFAMPEDWGNEAAAQASDPTVQRIEIRGASPTPGVLEVSPERVVASLGITTTFDMSNGEELQLSPRGTGVRMKVGNRFPVTLQPKHGAFVSADGRLELHVALDRYDAPARASLTMPVGW